MRKRCALAVFLIVFLASAVLVPAQEPDHYTMWLVPHFHHDVAFRMTEPMMNIEAAFMTRFMVFLGQIHPDFKFVLDQVPPIDFFIGAFPDGGRILKDFVSAGRVEITGAMYIQPDLELAAGESYVRQIELGQKYYRETFGIEASGMWNIDSFGHPVSMPQICAKSGLNYVSFARNENHGEIDPVFLWRSPDGSMVPTTWMHGPDEYYSGFFIGVTGVMSMEFETVKGVFDSLSTKHHPCGHILVPCGTDMVFAGWAITDVADAWNQNPPEGYPVTLKVATASEYFNAVSACEEQLPIYDLDVQTTWNGYYTSRIDLKQRLRESENRLCTWEKLEAMAFLLAGAEPAEDVDENWELVLINEFHDILPGSTMDENIQSALDRFDRAEDRIERGITESLTVLAEAMDTSGARDAGALAMVLFNPTSWERRGPVRIDLDLPEDWDAFRIVDANGREHAYQLIDVPEEEIAVEADLPPLGWTVLYLMPGVEPSQSPFEIADHEPVLDNDWLRLRFDEAGTFSGIEFATLDLPDVLGPVNELVCQCDYGSVYGFDREEPDQPLGRTSDFDQTRTRYTGPVLSRMIVEGPFVDSQVLRETVLGKDSPRIDFRTFVDWQGADSRIVAELDLYEESGNLTTSIPYGIIRREETGLYDGWAAVHWADYARDQGGFTIANRGLPFIAAQDGMVSTILLRATDHFTPYIPIPMGQMHGTHRFEYALLPHEGSWDEAGSYRFGWEMNRPVEAVLTGIHAGDLPDRFSLISTQGHAVDTVFRIVQEGYELRYFHNSDRAGPMALTFSDLIDLREVEVTDLKRQVVYGPELQGRTILLNSEAQEIVTLRLDLGLHGAGGDDGTGDDDDDDRGCGWM